VDLLKPTDTEFYVSSYKPILWKDRN